MSSESVLRLLHDRIGTEPDWLTGDLQGYPGLLAPEITTSQSVMVGPGPTTEPGVAPRLQQSDLLRPLLMDIAKHGLPYAYEKYKHKYKPWPPKVSQQSIQSLRQTKNPQKVIIVGAGMAGLVAAKELVRAGHTVVILETQDRIGGRVKTIGGPSAQLGKGESALRQGGTNKDGNGTFDDGLYADAGAMRLPCPPDTPVDEMTHFLTDYYAELFGLCKLPFVNQDYSAYLKLYHHPKIKQSEWYKNDQTRDAYTTDFWPGWDDRIKRTGGKAKFNIKDINDYYAQTTEVIIDLLRDRLAGVVSSREQSIIWEEWVNTWCKFSLEGYLTSTLESIRINIPKEADVPSLEKLAYLLPWPQAALTAYTHVSYTIMLDTSIIFFLRDQMGEWWSPNMHRFKGGMSELTKGFEKFNKGQMRKWTVELNVTVNKIQFQSTQTDIHRNVVVSGTRFNPKTRTRESYTEKGDAVIVTTPIHILRQIKFEPIGEYTPPLPYEFYNAISDIWYGPSTKIMLQCKKRFWEDEGIRGGFTKTTLPIGQLHYPSNPKGSSTYDGTDKGILLVYTWKSEALMFGALEPQMAVDEAVSQITEIHPKMKKYYDNIWYIEPWYNEPSAQGAYCLLKPNQYQNVRWLMYPWQNVYFAGEGISFASGWIQGALESGLRAAYQFYSRNEQDEVEPDGS